MKAKPEIFVAAVALAGGYWYLHSSSTSAAPQAAYPSIMDDGGDAYGAGGVTAGTALTAAVSAPANVASPGTVSTGPTIPVSSSPAETGGIPTGDIGGNANPPPTIGSSGSPAETGGIPTGDIGQRL